MPLSSSQRLPPSRAAFAMWNDTLFCVVVFAAVLAVAAVVLATRHILLHLRHYSRPQFQLHIVRILAMVPLYSLTSWFALVITNETQALVLELVRDSYEAYVIYNFVVLLIKYGGGDLHLCRYLEDQPRMSHPWPLNMWLPPLKLGPAFLNSVRASVLQFVFVKPTGSVLKLYAIKHHDRTMRTLILACVALVNNISISCALYGLVLFYHAAHTLLLPFRPFEKFLSVKAVVFFSFWQGVALGVAVRLGVLHDVQGYSAREQATGLQDFLICFEMAVAAVAHYYVFSYSEYEAAREQGSSKYAFWHVVDFRDVLSDAHHRISGGVGFEAELREEPIVANGNGSSNVLGEQSGALPRRADYGSARVEGGGAKSLSADLMATPWRLPSMPSSRQPP
eukprot:TRINITY_DN1826_c0_g1_i1.p2 TRINITY_DN1826_c0_g1~~TRINITY_DN1826_c0_g1_i1.p2  ORF type:complete len:394 (-),score=83.86 TRINITY_DN1826_c0_g1_i1:2164-3345(-)